MPILTILKAAILLSAIAWAVRWVMPRRTLSDRQLPPWQRWSYLGCAGGLILLVVVASLTAGPSTGPAACQASVVTGTQAAEPPSWKGPLLVRMVLMQRLASQWVPLAYAEGRCQGDQACRLEITAPDAHAHFLGNAIHIHAVFLIPSWATQVTPAGTSAPQGWLSCARGAGLMGQSMLSASISLEDLLEAHGGHLERLTWSEPPLSAWDALAVLPPHRRGGLAIYLGAQELTATSTLRQEPLDGDWISSRIAQEPVASPPAQGGLALPAAATIVNPGLALLVRLHLAGFLLVISSLLVCRVSPRPYLTACVCAVSALLLTIMLDGVMVHHDLCVLHDGRSSEALRAQARGQARGSCYFQGLVARSLGAPAPGQAAGDND